METKTDLTEMVTSMEEPVEEVTTRAEGLWRANRAEDNAGARGDRYQPRGTGGAEEQGRASIHLHFTTDYTLYDCVCDK